MDFFLKFSPAWLLNYYYQLSSVHWWYIANTAFFLLVVSAACFSFYCFRRGLGWEKFKGKWYSPEDVEQLKQELYSGVRDGRLPDAETMAFLDKHIYGKESKLRRMSGTGWL